MLMLVPRPAKGGTHVITIEYANAHAEQLRREAAQARRNRNRTGTQQPSRLRRLVRRSGR